MSKHMNLAKPEEMTLKKRKALAREMRSQGVDTAPQPQQQQQGCSHGNWSGKQPKRN